MTMRRARQSGGRRCCGACRRLGLLWFDAAQCAVPLVAEAGATCAAVLKKLRDSQLHSAKRLCDALDAEFLRVDKMAR